MTLNRRRFLQTAAVSTIALPASLSGADGGQGRLVYVGTYTGRQSKGIYAFRFDKSGKLTPLGVAAETRNPAYVTVHPNGRFLYAANEINEYKGEKAGCVTSFAIDSATGKLTELNAVSSKGPGPCYISTDKHGRVALIANYMGGNFIACQIGTDGRLSEATSEIHHSGSGPVKDRQDAPHAHSLNASPDDRFAIGADLGLDKLWVFKLDASKGTLTPNSPEATETEPGAGPRHFAFHPNGRFAFSINELQSTITSYGYDRNAGKLTRLKSVSTLPAGFKGQTTTAHIVVHPHGKFVYGSNRGHDSIAVFSVDDTTGALSPVEITPTGGRTPRNFAVDPSGAFLLAANQNSNNIAVFRIDQNTGKLTDTNGTVEVGAPVCVKFV